MEKEGEAINRVCKNGDRWHDRSAIARRIIRRDNRGCSSPIFRLITRNTIKCCSILGDWKKKGQEKLVPPWEGQK